MGTRRSHSHHTHLNELADGTFAKVTRALYRSNSRYAVHDHDHPEVFWIESGYAMHVCGEQRQRLSPGTVVFIRAEDVHGFETIQDHEFTLVNIELSPDVVSRLKALYGACLPSWPWPEHALQPLPEQRQLDPHGLDAVQAWADVAAKRADRLSVDALILTLLDRTRSAGEESTAAPRWLVHAVNLFSDTKHLQSGVGGLADLAGRGMAHLNRTVRLHYGITATDLVNRVRLEHACRHLAMSDESIINIALDCGFESLSYFYRIFRRAQGETPLRYRARHRAAPRQVWT